MIPTFAMPGEITPGQLGPTSVVCVPARYAWTAAMSRTGIPSVMQTVSSTPASAASKIASAANRGGTKIIDVLAPVRATASATVSNTGMPSTFCPALPGVTPATTDVPYARLRNVWNVPSEPVMPCTTSFVSEPTRTLTRRPPAAPLLRRRRPPAGPPPPRPFLGGGRPSPPPPRSAGAPPRRGSGGPPRRSCRQGGRRSEPSPHLRERLEDPFGHDVTACDPAEDVDEDAP